MTSFGHHPGQSGQQPAASGYDTGYGTGYRTGYGSSYGPSSGPPGYPTGYAQNYGGGRPPSRPGAVITAAVFGFIVGAVAVFQGVALLAGDSFSASVDGRPLPAGQLLGLQLILALPVLAFAVIMIWGSILAVTGRSRVLLIVGSSIVAGLSLITFLSMLAAGLHSGEAAGGETIIPLALFIVGIAILVLISITPSGQYFAALRARRISERRFPGSRPRS